MPGASSSDGVVLSSTKNLNIKRKPTIPKYKTTDFANFIFHNFLFCLIICIVK